MFKRLLQWANLLKREAVTLWFCTRNPQTPRAAKILALMVVAYAFSPIDLIPDFIPVLGFLDDAILLPIGIWIVLRLIPSTVIESSRVQAEQWLAEEHGKPRNWFGATVIIALWIVAIWFIWRWFTT